jgi:hypothetical protein
MDPDIDSKLESLIDAELKSLPPLTAPASLAPRVMALLAERARLPWWRRAWWEWPLTAKAAFLVIGVVLAGAAGSGGIILDQGLVDYSQDFTSRLPLMTTLRDCVQTLSGALNLIWQKAGQPLLLYALAGVGALYIVCVGLGTACVRYAMKRF